MALVYVGKYEQKGVEFNTSINFKHLAVQSVTRGSIRMTDIVYSKKDSCTFDSYNKFAVWNISELEENSVRTKGHIWLWSHNSSSMQS